MKESICPKCNKPYKDHPAISRIDNKMEICPTCGLREAIESMIKCKPVKKNKKHSVRLVS